jgi:hypothetical protein
VNCLAQGAMKANLRPKSENINRVSEMPLSQLQGHFKDFGKNLRRALAQIQGKINSTNTMNSARQMHVAFWSCGFDCNC